ncbi:30S ribosomal protein S4 [Candidatus Pacearchaeota archaeon]|nr:30S ribosomal protein S4 [Candidatus Pacearchaeota archaeon]
MIRKHKRYSRPRKLYDKARIENENLLLKRYGLKSKREIWKAEAAVDRIRKQAKSLITSSKEEQEKLFEKLRKIGFDIKNTADALALNKENWLKRRLQSLVVEKKLARTPKEARQLIAHKHISIGGKRINIPSYIVPVDEEDKIEIKTVRKISEKNTEKN